MKKMILAATAVLLMASCGGSDDDATSNNEASIVGSYILTELNVSQAIDLDDDGVASADILDEAPCFDGSLVFSSAGTFTSNTDELNIIGTVDSDGNEVTFVECFGPFQEMGTYSIEGNVITFTGNDDDQIDTDLGPSSGSFTLEDDTLTISAIASLGQIQFVYQRQ